MKSRPLTDTEVTQILNELHNLRYKCLFVLGIKTGFRISELLSLTISDVQNISQSAINSTLTIARCNMKGKHTSRSVPLHQDAKDILKSYITTLGSVAPDTKLFPICRRHAGFVIRQAARKLGLEGVICPHSMRKTFGMSIYKRSNKDIVATQHALGHASLSSTTHYLSVNKDVVDNLILTG